MPGHTRVGVILVVDDQGEVRAVLRRQLSDLGHTVLEAGDGAEALHLVRRRNGAVDLVLSDVVIPQMNGTELAAHICVEFPEIPVMLMTAFAVAGVTQVGMGDTIVPLLRKPFDQTQLGTLVGLALQHPVSPAAAPRAPVAL